MAGLKMDIGIKDVVLHEKDGSRTVVFYGESRRDGERLFTVNMNVNNCTEKGYKLLKEVFGDSLNVERALEMNIKKHPTLDTYIQADVTEPEESKEKAAKKKTDKAKKKKKK